jgi:predicted phage terminase large subunit-like protein
VWARKGADFYLVDRVYERLNFPNTLVAFQAQLRRFPQIGPKLIEDKANGPAVISTLERKIPGLVAVTPEGGKIARANAISYLHRAGNVYYPAEFEHDVRDTSHVLNMIGFPHARHDDSVDAETQMLTYWAAQHNALIETLERLRKEQQ